MSDRLSRLFGALADPTRRDLVARLTVGDATVGQLAAPYDMSKQAVSKHLKVLVDAGLVVRDPESPRQPVHLEHEVLGSVLSWVTRHQRAAEERLGRLDSVLAEMNDSTTTGSTSSDSTTTDSTTNDSAAVASPPDRTTVDSAPSGARRGTPS